MIEEMVQNRLYSLVILWVLLCWSYVAFAADNIQAELAVPMKSVSEVDLFNHPNRGTITPANTISGSTVTSSGTVMSLRQHSLHSYGGVMTSDYSIAGSTHSKTTQTKAVNIGAVSISAGKWTIIGDEVTTETEMADETLRKRFGYGVEDGDDKGVEGDKDVPEVMPIGDVPWLMMILMVVCYMLVMVKYRSR